MYYGRAVQEATLAATREIPLGGNARDPAPLVMKSNSHLTVETAAEAARYRNRRVLFLLILKTRAFDR